MRQDVTASASVSASINDQDGTPVEPPKKRRGAPKGSTNAIKHGLVCQQLPPGCSYIKKIVTQFRATLEKIILQERGEVTPLDGLVVISACRWEAHALMAARWLRTEYASLTPDQRLAFSRDVAKASDARDKCVRELQIDRNSIANLDKGSGLTLPPVDHKLFDFPSPASPTPTEPAADAHPDTA